MAKTIMNFGCGIFCPDGYVNVDGSLTVLLAQMPIPAALYGPREPYIRAIRAGHVKHGTARRLRVPAATLDGFYASHVLEHMSRADCLSLLERVRLWLKPNGLVRIVLPDLHLLADQYASGTIDADHFVTKMHTAIDGMGAWQVASSHAFHRWMYDPSSFTRIMVSLGFRDVQVCKAAESALAEFAELDRKIGREDQSFYVEAAPGR
ncbi:MAG TPA: methyltransferase domain-containing protein [Acetobacteraceae bacterium]|nr:methyltransferase domain-containing protein [Acetobacteraceae bacterium]